jgi:hypothetical protein
MLGGFEGEMRCREDGCAIILHQTIFIPTLTQFFCTLCRKTISKNLACHMGAHLLVLNLQSIQ